MRSASFDAKYPLSRAPHDLFAIERRFGTVFAELQRFSRPVAALHRARSMIGRSIRASRGVFPFPRGDFHRSPGELRLQRDRRAEARPPDTSAESPDRCRVVLKSDASLF